MLERLRHIMIPFARAALLAAASVLLAGLGAVMPGAPALAADKLPISGPYGDVAAKGCDDYTAETEGGYIVVDKDGRGWGSGGECGCKVKSVTKAGKNEYAVVASCQCIDGPKETWRRKLIVLGDSEIEWNGDKYRKCKPLP
jgi:hypothetical protein